MDQKGLATEREKTLLEEWPAFLTRTVKAMPTLTDKEKTRFMRAMKVLDGPTRIDKTVMAFKCLSRNKQIALLVAAVTFVEMFFGHSFPIPPHHSG